jgi:hypothetical protein
MEAYVPPKRRFAPARVDDVMTQEDRNANAEGSS